MVLDAIINGKEVSEICLIADTVSQSGLSLLKCFMVSIARRYETIKLILSENSAKNFLTGLDGDTVSKTMVYDGWSDPCGIFENMEDLFEKVEMDLALLDSPAVVFIHTLSHSLLHKPLSVVCAYLLRLSSHKSCNQLIVTVHADLHSEGVIAQLEHVASTIVNVKEDMQCAVLLKKTSGKIIRSLEEVTIKDDYILESCVPVIAGKLSTMSVKGDEHVAGPSDHMPFKILLSDQEKQARNRLVLPYAQVRDKRRQANAALEKAGGYFTIRMKLMILMRKIQMMILTFEFLTLFAIHRSTYGVKKFSKINKWNEKLKITHFCV